MVHIISYEQSDKPDVKCLRYRPTRTIDVLDIHEGQNLGNQFISRHTLLSACGPITGSVAMKPVSISDYILYNSTQKCN